MILSTPPPCTSSLWWLLQRSCRFIACSRRIRAYWWYVKLVLSIKKNTVRTWRWRADTSRVLGLDQFWSVVATSHQARLPLQQLHLFCQQRFGDGPDEKHGQEGQHIRRLVCYRGATFEDEYAELVRDSSIWFQTRIAMAASGATDNSQWLCRLATALIIRYYSSTMRLTRITLRRLCLCFVRSPTVASGDV